MTDVSRTLLLPGRARPDALTGILADPRFTTPLAGVDEAGRGPWAGPVVAAAVILPDDGMDLTGLDDSKKIKEPAREDLFDRIVKSAAVGVGIASVEDIDRLNILHATFLAMRRAVEALREPPGFVLIDGNKVTDVGAPAACLIGGDGVCAPIAAASIVAKVTRDRLMNDLAKTYPAYAWQSNKGYGTPAHARAIAEYGVTAHHRRSFKPIREALEAAG